ncbi:cupin domain-containing protein [Sphingomonas sp. UYEF23]|uniref:cupin domain-containing protein n=1 Tax=Sphingomonas sp. UYEF23 TaxID=1756408 RepID=UPI0033955E31
MERRVLNLANPTATHVSAEATSGTISGCLQALMPGELARPHRHSMHALRFVLEGEGAETIVEGKVCAMEPGDLVVTPGWTWHEHRNAGGAPTLWVDILDVAFHRAFGTARFQPGPIQNATSTLPDSAFTGASFVPVVAQADPKNYSPVFRYAWADAQRAVAAAPADSDGSRTVRYADPVSGGAVLPTIDCYLTQIGEGDATQATRSSASTLCVVAEGAGETWIGEEVLAWEQGDVIALPQDQWISHRCATGPARLFLASNREIYRKFGLLKEERAA